MPYQADPVAWIRELGCTEPWPYDVFESFVRVFLSADRRRQMEARHTLAALDGEIATMVALRSRTRLN